MFKISHGLIEDIVEALKSDNEELHKHMADYLQDEYLEDGEKKDIERPNLKDYKNK